MRTKIILLGLFLLWLCGCASLRAIKERDALLAEKSAFSLVMQDFGSWDKSHQENIICQSDFQGRLTAYRKERDGLLKEISKLNTSAEVISHKQKIIAFKQTESKKEIPCLRDSLSQ